LGNEKMGDTNVSQSQVGVIGDATIYGGIHFYRSSTGKPLQRPAPVDHFTDRDRELKQLLEDFQPGRVVTLCGPGGIGKTALSSKAVWTLAPAKEPPKQFPDGIIFHSFYGKPDMALAFEHIVRSFDEESRDTSPEAAFRVLSGKQALLILDGTEEAGDLRSVLQIRGNCGVIVTSRKRQDAVAELQNIESLDLDEAAKLLQAWAMDQAGEEEVVKHICEIVGGLPLAVRLAGRYLLQTGEPALEYLEWLKESPLEALHLANRKLESAGILLKRSLDQVSEFARDVLSVCGLLAFSPFNGEVIAAAVQEIQIREPLNELIFYGLLNRFGGQYEISHALIHTYARERLKSDDAVIGRLAGYYKVLADEYGRQGLEGYNRLDLDRSHIMKVMEGCRDRSEWDAIKDLVWAVEDYLNIRGYWTERQSALEMGVRAAKESDDRYNEGVFLGNQGNAYSVLGQAEKAIEYYEQALEVSREIGDRQNEGTWLGNLGNAYSALGQVEKAVDYLKQSLAIFEEIKSPNAEWARQLLSDIEME
jgi:tetratricopeptide (TPR) repeat protein